MESGQQLNSRPPSNASSSDDASTVASTAGNAAAAAAAASTGVNIETNASKTNDDESILDPAERKERAKKAQAEKQAEKEQRDKNFMKGTNYDDVVIDEKNLISVGRYSDNSNNSSGKQRLTTCAAVAGEQDRKQEKPIKNENEESSTTSIDSNKEKTIAKGDERLIEEDATSGGQSGLLLGSRARIQREALKTKKNKGKTDVVPFHVDATEETEREVSTNLQLLPMAGAVIPAGRKAWKNNRAQEEIISQAQATDNDPRFYGNNNSQPMINTRIDQATGIGAFRVGGDHKEEQQENYLAGDEERSCNSGILIEATLVKSTTDERKSLPYAEADVLNSQNRLRDFFQSRTGCCFCCVIALIIIALSVGLVVSRVGDGGGNLITTTTTTSEFSNNSTGNPVPPTSAPSSGVPTLAPQVAAPTFDSGGEYPHNNTVTTEPSEIATLPPTTALTTALTAAPTTDFCALELNFSCVPQTGDLSSSCARVSPELTLLAPQCEGRPTEMGFLFSGGLCNASWNVQVYPYFTCEDLQVGRLQDGEQAYIVIVDARLDVVYFSGWVGVGEVFYANDNGERVGADQIVLVYNSSDISDDSNLRQRVQFHSSCSSNLFLGDIFGSVQVVEVINEEQGVVSLFSHSFNVDYSIGIDIISRGPGATITSMTVVTTVDPNFFNLTDEVIGTVVLSGETFQTEIDVSIDLEERQTYVTSAIVDYVTNSGISCRTTEASFFTVG